jgi:hypothetical protein
MTSLLICAGIPGKGPTQLREQKGKVLALDDKEMENMLGLLAAVLIVLWLLGFFAFHVTTAFIHLVLVVGLILLVLHFVRGSASA